ncbi:MAG TPA: CRTAC1 family protein [Thermoanaerobaculia bacterium]|nr:CRTAC1 family protein [Thermoanaerobaculia bacterium]
MHFASSVRSPLKPARALVAALLYAVAALVAAGCGKGPESGSPPLTDRPAGHGEPVLFVDAAIEVGIDFVYFNGMTGELHPLELIGAGAALFDYDGDGDLDLYLVQGGMMEEGRPVEDALFPPHHPLPLSGRLYRNELRQGEPDTLRFTDVTAESGIAAIANGYGMGVAVGDYDGDGRPDLYLTNFGPNQLVRNGADGRWRDVTAVAGTGDPRWSVAAAFFDADRDGDLDLWVGNYVAFDPDDAPTCYDLTGAIDYCGPGKFLPEPDVLYRNRGDGTFEDATEAFGLGGLRNPALGVVVADFDADGWLDLYVANDARPNYLWLADGAGRFREQAMLGGAALSGAGEAQASMGIAAGDFDGDGLVDLFMTHLVREPSTLYRNLGGGLFEDATRQVRLAAPTLPFTSFGTGFLDFDNDGWLDLLQVNGGIQRIPALVERGDPFPLHQPNQLFRNRGDGTFEDISAEAGPVFALSEVSRGAAFGDVNNDGAVDVLITNTNAPARLLVNQVGARRHWLGVRLLEGEPPRDAPGAEARLERRSGPALTRFVRIDGSYASSSDPRIVFGLGDSPEYQRVLVRWPDGTREEWSGLPVGAYSTLLRGRGEARP